MKKSSLFILGVPLAITGLAAELVISAFNGNGELTWTNSVSSNATYRVEWAGSATGPWNKFDALANLTLLSATSNVVTVKVPTFYRVVWVDAPPQAGIWNYSGFDPNGSLIVTGRLTISASTNPVTGSWSFSRVPDSGSDYPHGVGRGDIQGFFEPPRLGLDLDPYSVDGDFRLAGDVQGNMYTGQWRLVRFGGVGFTGPFSAERQEVDP